MCMYMIFILEASVLLCSTRIAVEIEASRRCALWIDNRDCIDSFEAFSRGSTPAILHAPSAVISWRGKLAVSRCLFSCI